MNSKPGNPANDKLIDSSSLEALRYSQTSGSTNSNGDVTATGTGTATGHVRLSAISSATGQTSSSMNAASTGGRPTSRKSTFAAEEKAKLLKRKQREKTYIICCRTIIENKFTITFMTLLTLYALTGDDMRLLYTNKPADNAFNVLTIACIVIFFAEVVLSSFGKKDYFGGFFFILDLVSTSTLIFDLTWVADLIVGDDEDTSKGGATGTAKIGARTARVVRVLRLVRILKLYKAIYEARQAQKKRDEAAERRRKGASPGESDDNWNADTTAEGTAELLGRGESRVGKRLSDLTTRRVILLVLTMMLVLPILAVNIEQQLPFSPVYGADLVHDSFLRWQAAPDVTQAENKRKTSLHSTYVNNMLQMVYYHNWYTGHRTDCPQQDSLCANAYYNMIFWVGIVSKTDNVQALQSKAIEHTISGPEADKFMEYATDQFGRSKELTDLYTFGLFPEQVLKTIKSPWTSRCDGDKVFRIGFSLLKDEISEGWDGGENPGVSYALPCPEDLRPIERSKFSARIMTGAEAEVWHVGFYFDKRSFSKQEAMFSLCITSFVCVVLCVASIMFSADADKLVLHPVEQMISKVEKIRDNPLSAMKMSDEEFRQEQVRKDREAEEKEELSKWQKTRDCIMCTSSKKEQQEPMETMILEKTIIKIGSLLALGFGEAGANIIAHNMSGVESALVTAMVDGIRVECIIGCARIKDFSTATEVLRGKIMTYVNQISEIVHGIVDEQHGAANKNNGEYFLLIWRTSDLDPGYSSKLADMSMLAFTRILGAIHRSPVLAAYRLNPGLQMRLLKNCRVNCGFALHYGWAIEGAVGSEFKIDASYLSPNVSISESLEGASNIYGVSILISEAVINLCTPQMAAKCRLIDRVLLTGTIMELYSIDLDYMSLTTEPHFQCPPWNPRNRFRCRQFMEQEKAMKWLDEVKMVSFFNEDPDVATMRFRYTLEFMHVFNMGYQNYIEGEWKVAQRFLTLTRTMLGTPDGPSAALLRFMETHKFEKPTWWSGYRDLGLDGLGL